MCIFIVIFIWKVGLLNNVEAFTTELMKIMPIVDELRNPFWYFVNSIIIKPYKYMDLVEIWAHRYINCSKRLEVFGT